MRGFDRDLIRGRHYGQRPCVPREQAEHMAAPTSLRTCRKALLTRSRPHMAQSGHAGMSALFPLSGVKRHRLLRPGFSLFYPKTTRVCPLLLRCTALTCYTRHSPWGHRDAAARVHWLARLRRRLAFCIGRTKRRTGRRTMRAIGLVLLSIAIMALLLTDADAK